MAKPQVSQSKQDFEKRKLQKRKEKEARKEERRANARDGKSLDNMIAYVDEFGNITDTPPDPAKKSVIRHEDIVIGSRNLGGNNDPAEVLRTGKVTFFNSGRGFGFIRDDRSQESIFVHVNALSTPIQENDRVSFETQRGHKGLSAVNVKKL